jgi:hypothetical protein
MDYDNDEKKQDETQDDSRVRERYVKDLTKNKIDSYDNKYNDHDDVPVPRHAGPLPGLSQVRARHPGAHGRRARHALQRWRRRGSVLFGHLSERIGRRFSMVGALGVCLCVLPFWAFGGSLAVLAAAALVMRSRLIEARMQLS